MATAIAERIVGKLIAASAVEEVDRELYIYGFFLLITRFFFFLVTVVFGFSLRIPCESVIFYIVFILLRSYAGGIHAKTEMACTIWTTLAMGTATVTIKVLKASNAKLPLCFLLCNVCLLAFSPLGNRGKPLDASERCRYRKVCIGLIVAFDMVAIIANFIVIPTFYYPVICGMCLEAILLCIGKMCNM